MLIKPHLSKRTYNKIIMSILSTGKLMKNNPFSFNQERNDLYRSFEFGRWPEVFSSCSFKAPSKCWDICSQVTLNVLCTKLNLFSLVLGRFNIILWGLFYLSVIFVYYLFKCYRLSNNAVNWIEKWISKCLHHGTIIRMIMLSTRYTTIQSISVEKKKTALYTD